MIRTIILAVLIAVSAVTVIATLHPTEPAQYAELPSLRDQAKLLDRWRDERVARIPALLQKYNVDAWLMSQREYAEDTIWWSIKGATEFAPHRRTVLLFHTNTSSLAGQPNPLRWVDNTGQVWQELLPILEVYNPKKIAINIDKNIAFGGGLHVGEYEVLKDQLGQRWTGRMVNQPMIGVEYVAARVSGQLRYYTMLQDITWALVGEAFSEKVIAPGITSTEDIEWWFREKMQERNVSTWNHPRVSVITPESFPGWAGTKDIIQEGDVLHVDFGITAMGMNTDVQHMAYVLRSSIGETDVPKGLKKGMRKANRMQNILLERMVPGKTGNDVLSECLEHMKKEDIEGQIYSHPIGDWGHAPGAVMGFTNLPEFVPVLGELPLLPNTYYSIELYAYHFVPERNETLRFRLEENVHWVDYDHGWRFVKGRQERYHLIDSSKIKNSVAFRIQDPSSL